ncbi:MAG TPA: substrate-binding domain-containing protein [Casimicrobiaceae bacterium]|nr:substrate-binding domain-containing protein [Casimicrobiaceae bacterium]
MTGTAALRVLSAGAAKGVVQSLARDFEADTGAILDATFDSAGAIRDAVAAGNGCDLVILPAAMLEALAGEGFVDAASIAALGSVPTGIATPDGDPRPDVHDAESLRANLAEARALYCPDTVRSTAGKHFVRVLHTLGLLDASKAKLRAYPNGATAMAALAGQRGRQAIGCTQISEILYTTGVSLVARLPAPFELSTIYAAAVSSRPSSFANARAFCARLTGDATRELRRAGGFLDRD